MGGGKLNYAAWKIAVEILILWFVYYKVMLFFKGTRAVSVLRGILMLAVVFFILQVLRLETLDWLLTHLLAISIIGLLIVFQPEIRRALARLGQKHFFWVSLRDEEIEEIVREIKEAVTALSDARCGALIAIEREDSLGSYNEGAAIIDGKVTSELIQTIFTPKSLLHDGGVVIHHGRIVSAGCIFPLTDKLSISRALGTRHRAAIGLTEQVDALAVVVSEETGAVSLSRNGKITRDIDTDELGRVLRNNFKRKKK